MAAPNVLASLSSTRRTHPPSAEPELAGDRVARPRPGVEARAIRRRGPREDRARGSCHTVVWRPKITSFPVSAADPSANSTLKDRLQVAACCHDQLGRSPNQPGALSEPDSQLVGASLSRGRREASPRSSRARVLDLGQPRRRRPRCLSASGRATVWTSKWTRIQPGSAGTARARQAAGGADQRRLVPSALDPWFEAPGSG